MACVVTPAYAGSYIRTFTVAADAADGATNSLATAHGLALTPTDFWVVDTSAAATVTGNVWAVHSVGVATFIVKKTIATAENRTALVVLRNPHSIDQ